MTLVLASASPRRADLLRSAGIPFLCRPAEVSEIRLEGEPPVNYVRRLAAAKADAIHAEMDQIVLGADTTVVIDGQVLEKPHDAADARRMLRLLSGRVHEVITGVCLRAQARRLVDSESTRVRFVPLDDAEIESYVASGEPFDKAGAYAIQGRASRFVDRVEGCYFNVVGLPVALVWRRLRELTAFTNLAVRPPLDD
jgi:septum formation protein